MKTLYVSDLDGTLLNSCDQLSPYTLKVVNELVQKGMTFTYATARSLTSASIVARGLTTDIPAIVYNGAFTKNAATGEVLSSFILSEEEKQFIRDILSERGIYPLVYSIVDGAEKVSWLPSHENEGIRRYLSLRIGDRRLTPLGDESMLYRGDAFYFTCIGEREELLPVFQALKEEPRFNCLLQQELYRLEYWCEIMHKQATKANAALRLKEILGCERIVSFGDALNDIPMFLVSDECYAVENAVPELKEHATAIIPNNDEDGVAKWLAANCGR